MPKKTQQPPKRSSTSPSKESSNPPTHMSTPGFHGWITHTELASADPDATKTWCAAVLG